MSYARHRCACVSCSMSAKARVVVLTLVAPFVIVLAAPLWVPLMAVRCRARACVRRFFGVLTSMRCKGGYVIVRSRRFLVVDVRPSRRDEPASALLLHLPHLPHPQTDAADQPSKAIASSAVDWPHHQGESLEPFLVTKEPHLTKEQLEHAAFLDKLDGKWPRWSLWMDCAQPAPLHATAPRPDTAATLAAVAASSPQLPLFSNARTATAQERRTHSRTLHCEADVDLFLVGRAPWLSALVLPHDIAARRIQRSWRKAIGDPSMQLCRRRLLDEARELENLFSRQGRGRAPPLDRAKA